MAGTTCEDSAAGRSLEGFSSGLVCESSEALTEWRSCEQVENDTPSTAPSCWETDDSDDDGGLKPFDLYGKYTWKIENFSTINKRELKSNAFEVGGYKWYILIYPQGCDVCNHLSLFLCVADHDKLLPGWSHFAQFTIGVVNKDPKKSKYSDTLHRFWKKEHDWGWKKYMELSKVSDGFLDADTLIIKAQVQVIRERRDRPFRYLDCHYRRELVRVYLTNVEQIFRRFVDDRRGKLQTLLEDKAKWSSFGAFWLGIKRSTRRLMSSEKLDLILKMIVKHFFIEKDVTSTLVIDSLYSGFKALKGQSKCMLGKAKVREGEDIPAPVVRVEEEMFVLVDDVLLLLERATMEPLPPKDEKGPQNRTKDGGAGEDFSKDSIERDERRLTELGRTTLEIFVLAHIFSKIDAAYQEAIALKRQDELIQEEKAESEQRAKREVAEKEKRLKKKQSKQKRNNRKAKDKVKYEKPSLVSEDKHIHGCLAEVNDSLGGETILEKDGTPEDVSDASDSVEFSAEILQPDSEDRDASPVNWDTDISEVHLPAEAGSSATGSDISSLHLEGDKSSSMMDDSSSTCSSDSTPSLATNESCKGNSPMNNKSKRSPIRGKNQRAKATYQEANRSKETNNLTSEPVKDLQHLHRNFSGKAADSMEPEATVSSLQEPMKQPEPSVTRLMEETIVLQKKQSNKIQAGIDRQPKEKPSEAAHLPQSPSRNTISAVKLNPDPKDILFNLTPASKSATTSMQHTNKAASVISAPQTSSTIKPDSIKAPAPLLKPTEKPSGQQPTFLISRPLSTPPIPGSKPAVTAAVSMAQTAKTAPVLSRSVSATGRLGSDRSQTNHHYPLPSYKNAILGNVATTGSSSFSQPSPPSPSPLPSQSFFQSSIFVPGPIYVTQAAERLVQKSVNSGISYSAAAREAVMQSGRQQWLDNPQREEGGGSMPMFGEIRNPDLNNRIAGSHDIFRSNFLASTSGCQPTQVGLLADEFPHLDIINDLLDDEQGLGSGFNNLHNQRFSSPTDLSMLVGLGSSPGSCRFERRRISHEALSQPEYGLPGNDYDTLPEYIPQGNIMPYMNGQIDELVHSQWPASGYDHLSMLSMRSLGVGDWYAYGIPECSDLACGLNGYTMFRP